jgi:hypothetical protein
VIDVSVRELASGVRNRAVGLAALMLGVAVTGPLLAPGFVLAYDMVFTPKPPMSRALLGLSSSLPRSVPTDLVVALSSRALTGQIVEKLILFGIFAAGAYGAARLVPAHRPPARVATGVLYMWNPFVYERLLFGHWALLAGYAALPWVAGAALAYRRGEPRSGARATLSLAAAALGGPYAGLFGGVIAAAVALFPSNERPPLVEGAAAEMGPSPKRTFRRATSLLAAALIVNAPWWVPWALHASVPGRPELATRLFRARSDSPLGLLGSVLSLGGLWRTDLAPPGRQGVTWIPAFALIVGLGWWGWGRLRSRWPAGAVWGMAILALLGAVVAIAPSVPILDAASRWASRVLPGGAILRDSQKFVMPLALLGSVAFGAGVERTLAAFGRSDRVAWAVALLLLLLPVALAPTLVWGAGGRLSPANYPPSWNRAQVLMAADPVPGAVIALPWHAYLPFEWNHGRTVRQPAREFFSRPVLADDSLQVGPFRLPAEGPWARLATPAATGRAPLGPSLARLGVRYLLLYKEADWRTWSARLEGMARLLDSRDLALYRAPAPGPIPTFPRPPIAPVLAADVVALTLVGWAAGVLLGVRFAEGRAGILRWRRPEK